MKWFGPSWGAPVCTEDSHQEMPGGSCAACEVPFIDGDQGVTLPYHGRAGDPPELSYHHSCFMWMIGVTHIHVMVHGKSLCGDYGMPNWPEGHSWRYIQAWREATCAKCRRTAYCMSTEVA